MELGLLGWVLGCAAAFAVGLAKGGLSMVGVISVPLMALVMSPVQAAGILLPVYVISDIGGLIGELGLPTVPFWFPPVNSAAPIPLPPARFSPPPSRRSAWRRVTSYSAAVRPSMAIPPR